MSDGTEKAAQEITETKPAEPAKPKETAKAIAIDPKTQLMIARDNGELFRMITVMMKGMAVPKSLDTPEKVIAAWQVAASLRLPPAIAIQNLAVIHGSVSLWGQLPKALAEATGELEDFKLLLIDEKQNIISLANKNLNAEVWGAVCQIKRKGRSENEYTFTLEDAKTANLLGKDGTWQTYRKIMLSRRAVAQAIKFEFPDALMGVPVAEYDFHQAPDLKDVTPANSEAQTIADKIKARAGDSQTQTNPEQAIA